MQRHQHERRDQHHLEPDVQIEDVSGQERAGDAHQQNVDQRVIAERLAPRVHAGERDPVTAAPMMPTIITSRALKRSATSVMPNGAGHDPIRVTWMPSVCDAGEQRHGGAQDHQRARERDAAQQPGPMRQQLQRDGRRQRHEDRQDEQHQSPSNRMASMSSVPADACTRCASTSENASTPKPMTMEVRIRDCGTGSANDAAATAPSSTIGGCPRVTPGGGEDEDVRSVREQAQSDDQLRQAPPQHQVQARRRTATPATMASTNSISSLGLP